MQYKFSTENTKRYRFPTHINDLIMDRSEATASEVFFTVVEPGKASPMHKHDDTEQIYYVVDGEGEISVEEEDKVLRINIKPGDLIRMPVGTVHRARCLGNQNLRYLVVDCFPGSRPDAEPTWDSHVHEICRLNGWDYDKVLEE
ncbi:MAG: cupin domain-containing protein [Candidatus Promineifilaceae bacterium]|nr:cupin domain-containing protein [Candidatus Promineifilaceae bacterium]